MAGAVMNKLWSFISGESANEEEYEEENLYDEVTEEENIDEGKSFFNRKSKIVSMPQVEQVKMVITNPTTFEQSEEICNYLKERKSVILNLEYVNKDIARRIIDFVSGSVHALNGNIQKISNSIFLVAPINYDISNQMTRDELKNKLSVSWLKN